MGLNCLKMQMRQSHCGWVMERRRSWRLTAGGWDARCQFLSRSERRNRSPGFDVWCAGFKIFSCVWISVFGMVTARANKFQQREKYKLFYILVTEMVLPLHDYNQLLPLFDFVESVCFKNILPMQPLHLLSFCWCEFVDWNEKWKFEFYLQESFRFY